MTRKEHLAWAKGRALQYVQDGDVPMAWTSFASDLRKHDEFANHIALELGSQLFIGGHLSTAKAMIDYIEGFN